jgi:uncharacterized membrane protein
VKLCYNNLKLKKGGNMSLPINLPAISIPEIPLPLEIPEIMHPAIVHFAIAIPVVIFLLEIYNLAAKRRTISAFSLFLLIIVTVAMFGAYLTGSVDGKATWDLLSTDAQGDLKAHKLLGMYLVYASAGLVIFKLLIMLIGKTLGRVFFIFILGTFIAVTLFQGKEGGELVYEYGANIEKIADMKSDAEDTKEELDEAEEKLTELQTKYDELVASTTKKETAVEEKASKDVEKATEETAATEDNATNETPETEKVTEEIPAETPAVAEEDKKEEAESNETATSTDTNSSN